MAFVYDNNVQCTLNTAINAVVTSIIVNAAVAPNRNPVAPTGGNIGVITLMDSLVSPTKIEVITYSTSTNNGDGTFTLSGCTRAQEGFTAQSFLVGATCIGAVTAAILTSLVPTGNSTLLQFCGDGSDGDATISTTITLTSDKYYRNLTMVAGGTINTGGYSIYVSGVLDLTLAIAGCISGPSGVAGTAGSSGGAGGLGAVGITTPSGTTGGGGSANVVQSGNSAASNAHIGGVGGDGGLGGANAIGSPGTGNTSSAFDVRRPGASLLFGSLPNSSGLGGGGGSCGANGQRGGGGGGGGGAIILFAGTILTSGSTPAAVIKAGSGGPGAVGMGTSPNNGGSGGGGGGGPIIVGYGIRVGPAVAAALSSAGGNAGGGIGPGFGGAGGAIHLFNLLAGSASSVAITAASGTTAGIVSTLAL